MALGYMPLEICVLLLVEERSDSSIKLDPGFNE